MAAADTNVLLRLLLDDDEQQGRAARAFQRTHAPLFVSHVGLAELGLVLVSAYEFSRERLGALLEPCPPTSPARHRKQ
jgi:predicted nucleic-acid-binding protein